MSFLPQVEDDGEKATVDVTLHLDRLMKLLDDVVEQLPEEQGRTFENTHSMMEGYMRSLSLSA